jgi:hypothetical protein
MTALEEAPLLDIMFPNFNGIVELNDAPAI